MICGICCPLLSLIVTFSTVGRVTISADGHTVWQPLKNVQIKREGTPTGLK